MKKTVIALILLLFGASILCSGQSTQLPADSKPASSNVRGAEFPRVTSDLKAIFRIKAPNAQKVQIRLDKVYDMIKDNEGFWNLTTDPIVPGFHYYFLLIDDVQVSDPADRKSVV
jgi:1,4-alpha-glucan branching enzyme